MAINLQGHRIYDENGLPINNANSFPVDVREIQSTLSEGNSTDVALGTGGIFTGAAELTNGYGILYVSVFSDVESATDGLNVQQSQDGTNWDFSDVFTIPANTGKTFSLNPYARYFRIIYTNGATPQTVFRLQAILKVTGKSSTHRIQDNIIDDDDGELILSVLKLRTAADTYVSGAATSNGNFKVSLEELENNISTNANSQLNVSPYIVDEYGLYNHILGDNMFQGALITIPAEHHEIHCGDSYEVSSIGDLANGASVDFAIVVPNEGTVPGTNTGSDQSIKQYHFKGMIDMEAEGTIEFYEGATIATTGTAINVFNRNRNSINADYLSMYSSITAGTTGTLLESHKIGSGKAFGGTVSRADEWILKNNTTYLLRITNNTTSDNYYDVHLDYYVHPGI